MLEGLWLRLMMGTEEVTRETALPGGAASSSAPSFPKHFSRDGQRIDKAA